ncbi:MAG: glycosyltransferase family 39 protein [Cyanobacteria bacterium P01_H01_bin.121]
MRFVKLSTQQLWKSGAWLDWLILGLGLWLLTSGLGQYGLYEPHEGHFAGVAYEMLLRHDWVTPHLNGAPYLNKPPLLYWLLATSQALFGANEFAARLPIALAAWFGVVMVWQWARELWNPSVGRVSATMLYLTAGWFLFAHQILTDILLCSLLIANNYCLWKVASLTSTADRDRYVVLFYGLLGLIMLTKGPFAFIFPAAGILSILVTQRRWSLLQDLKPWWGILIIGLIVAPWAVAIERVNPGFWSYFLINENLKRAADIRWPPDYAVSKTSAWGFLLVTAGWLLPWTPLFPFGLHLAQASVFEAEDQTLQHRERVFSAQQTGLTLLGVAAITPVLLFLPIPARLIYYSLPMIPAAIMLCSAWWLEAAPKAPLWQWRCVSWPLRLINGFVGLSLWVLPIWIVVTTNWPWWLYAAFLPLAIPWTILVWGCVLTVDTGLVLRRSVQALVGLTISLSLAYVAIAWNFGTIEATHSSKGLVQAANDRLGIETIWVFEGSRELGVEGAMAYYLNQQQPLCLAACSGDTGFAQARQRCLPGWVKGPVKHPYRIVYRLNQSDPNRIPPDFPGARPDYLIDKPVLQAYWTGDRPVVFVTDALRQPGDTTDPVERNLPSQPGSVLMQSGNRQLYGNPAANLAWWGNQATTTATSLATGVTQQLQDCTIQQYLD